MTEINEIRTEIAEGNLLTTLVFDGAYGWHWYASVGGVLWASGWVRGTRQTAYQVALKSVSLAIEAK